MRILVETKSGNVFESTEVTLQDLLDNQETKAAVYNRIKEYSELLTGEEVVMLHVVGSHVFIRPDNIDYISLIGYDDLIDEATKYFEENE